MNQTGLTLELGQNLLTGIAHVVPSQVIGTVGTTLTSTFANLQGYDWLFDLLESAWPAIMGGAFIVFLVKTIGAGYQLTVGNLSDCIKAIKWGVIGLFFLTLVPKLTHAIVELISNMEVF